MLKKLKAFIYVFKQSAFDVTYYQELLKTKFSFTLKYLFLLFLISIVLQIIIPSINIYQNITKIDQTGKKFDTTIKDLYPKELKFQIKNGRVFTNVSSPYYITAKYEGKKYPLLVIDQSAQVDDYPNYRTLILLTKDSIVYPDNQGETYFNNYRVRRIETNTNTPIISFNDYQNFYKKVSPLLNNLGYFVRVILLSIIIFAPIILTGFQLGFTLFITLVYSLIFWLISKIMGKKLSYQQIYRLSLHGLTLPSLVVFSMGLFNYKVPMVYPIVYLIFMIIVLKNLKASK